MIPQELQDLPQWCVARADKIPLGRGLQRADVTDPATWLDWDTASKYALEQNLYIGFVLSKTDPYCCVDLDVKDYQNAPDKPELWTTQEQFDLYLRIMQALNSYTETSVSGKGLHIWVRANIGRGARREGVEVYSQDRFMICTGRVVNSAPIADRNDQISNMISQMRRTQNSKGFQLQEVEEMEDDWRILELCYEAENADKFEALWQGSWENDYPSQSEADLALMSMLAFYTTSNEQCRRLFRESALGKRKKARRNDDYLNRTLAIIRKRQEDEQVVDFQPLLDQADYVIANRRKLALAELERMHSRSVTQRVVAPLHSDESPTNQVSTPTSVAAALAAPVAQAVQMAKGGLGWPPGFAGRIAQFIYQSAPRPVKEVAIVATLGLLAGICGKAWHIPQSGLNLYIILIARSAVGKEAMHSGISQLIRACSDHMPLFHNFVDFSEYVSGPALLKAVAANPSFVNVSGEWGRRLKRMAADEREGPLATLRTQMTNLYQKSGPQAIVGGLGYSNQDNNVASVAGVAYSMIGETTPGTFYESLTESMMEDGFLSRFLVVEYKGERPPANRNQSLAPDDALLEALLRLSYQAQNLINTNDSQPISRTEDAAKIMQAFELECDSQINSTNEESRRQMWNRAALKAVRIAALLAVADNWVTPVVSREHIEWAIAVVRANIKLMTDRIDSGDVGMNDDSRDRKLVYTLANYVAGPCPPSSYRVDPNMHNLDIIPKRYLQVKLQHAPAFGKHRMGSRAALDQCIMNALVNGYLEEIPRDKLKSAFDFKGVAYKVLDLPDYIPT